MSYLPVVAIRIEQGPVNPNQGILMLYNSDTDLTIPISLDEEETLHVLMSDEETDESRPQTLVLLQNILDNYSIDIVGVNIDTLKEGKLYASLTLYDGVSQQKIPCLPGDAVALAIHLGLEILTESSIIQEMGFHDKSFVHNSVQEENPTKDEQERKSMIEDLTKQLEEYVRKEDYEKAAMIQQMIDKLNTQDNPNKTDNNTTQ